MQGQTAWEWLGAHLVWWEASSAVLLRRDGEVLSQLSVREDAPSGTSCEDVLCDRELRSPPGHWGLTAVIWGRSTSPADIAVPDAAQLAPGAGDGRETRLADVAVVP